MDSRINLFAHSKSVKGHAVVSFDLGTHYMAVVRIVRCRDTGRRIMTHGAIVDLRDPGGAQTIDVIAPNLITLLMDPALAWIWYPVDDSNEWDHFVIVERQMDHIAQKNKPPEYDANGKLIPTKYRPPIMYAIYGMLRILCLCIRYLVSLVSMPMFGILQAKDIQIELMGNSRLEFIPRTGGQKLGLEDLRGDARKMGSALDIGTTFMEEEGDDEAAAWMDTHARPKPTQDVNDAYLQAAHYMNQREAEEEEQGQKPLTVKRKRAVSEDDEETDPLPTKKPRIIAKKPAAPKRKYVKKKKPQEKDE